MLILVTWAIASLSLMAAVLGVRSLFALSFSQRLERQLQARYIARAGIEQALAQLDADPTEKTDGLAERWRDLPEVFQEQPLGNGSFSVSYPGWDGVLQVQREKYGFLDEERKLPLNKADTQMLRALFLQAPDMTDERAKIIADSIADWRDADTDKSPDGAESFYYLGREHSYECKNAPFENIEELLFVQGMPPGLMDWAASLLSVHSAQVNLNTAGREVLTALGLSAAGVNGIVFYRAGEDNIEGTPDDRAVASVSAASGELAQYCPQEDLARLAQLAAQQLLSAGAKTFEVRVTADAERDAASRVRVRAVLDRQGKVLAWHEE